MEKYNHCAIREFRAKGIDYRKYIESAFNLKHHLRLGWTVLGQRREVRSCRLLMVFGLWPLVFGVYL
jgi:hypothetical protein